MVVGVGKMTDQENAQEITIIPVDENGRVLLFSDIKIEKVDRDFRTIREASGLTWKLQPGNYTVKIFLRTLEMKSVPLTVTSGVPSYRLSVPTNPAPITFQYDEIADSVQPQTSEENK